MPGPHVKFATRPIKRGARKRRRILEQKRRLIAAGVDKARVGKMNIKEVHVALMLAARKRGKKR